MRTDIRQKLDMAQRVLEFERAHATTPGAEPKLPAELAALVARGEELTGEQRDGILARQTSIQQRDDAKRMLHNRLVPYLVRVANKAAAELPTLSGVFRPTKIGTPDRVFANDVRRMLTEAKANAEVLAKNGLTPEVLNEVTTMLAAFEARIDNTNSARLGHIEASALLKTLKGELREVVRRLDGWNRFRFRNQPTLLVAWKAAMSVVVVTRGAAAPPLPEVSATGDPKAA